MNIEIRKLTPDFAEDYARFFDVTPHDVRSDKDNAELPCYCVTWRSDDSYVGNGDHWYPTREEIVKSCTALKLGAVHFINK